MKAWSRPAGRPLRPRRLGNRGAGVATCAPKAGALLSARRACGRAIGGTGRLDGGFEMGGIGMDTALMVVQAAALAVGALALLAIALVDLFR